MFIRKENKKVICEHLFNNGVMWARKNLFLPKHAEINVPNIQIIKLMRSFVSKEYVTVNFTWQTYYWRLTEKGHVYLQQFLNIPEDVMPNTWKQQGDNQALAATDVRKEEEEQANAQRGWRNDGGRDNRGRYGQRDRGMGGGRDRRDEFRGRGDGRGGGRGYGRGYNRGYHQGGNFRDNRSRGMSGGRGRGYGGGYGGQGGGGGGAHYSNFNRGPAGQGPRGDNAGPAGAGGQSDSQKRFAQFNQPPQFRSQGFERQQFSQMPRGRGRGRGRPGGFNNRFSQQRQQMPQRQQGPPQPPSNEQRQF